MKKTHGLCNTRLWLIWNNMRGRCYNSNLKSYKNYGGRGIKICDEWLFNISSFYDWSLKNGYEENLSIDR